MLSPTPPPLQKDDQVAICKSTNQIPDLYSNLGKCTSQAEQQQMNDFIGNTLNTKSDFDSMTANYNDMILSGDSLFGTSPNSTAIGEVIARNTELKNRHDELEKTIHANESISERADRDFIDTKETLPDSIPTRTVHVLEDYTLVVLSVSYIFLALSIMFAYTAKNNYSINSIITALIVASIGSGLLYTLAVNFM